jgi:hypothetical protein
LRPVAQLARKTVNTRLRTRLVLWVNKCIAAFYRSVL